MISIAKKDKAILFTSDAGISIAEKLCRLFKDSLPKTIAVEMIAYDYELLLQNGKKSDFSQKSAKCWRIWKSFSIISIKDHKRNCKLL